MAAAAAAAVHIHPGTVYVSQGGTQTDPISTKEALNCLATNLFKTMKSVVNNHLLPALMAGGAGAVGATYLGVSAKEIAKTAAIVSGVYLGASTVAAVAKYVLNQ
jgi:hypothetical protein